MRRSLARSRVSQAGGLKLTQALLTTNLHTLADHPMVRECAVLAIEGADQLTVLKAFVVLTDDASGSDQTTNFLQDYVKTRLLPYKYPRIISYLDGLPNTGSGKIDQQALLKRNTT
jgi:acyl-coenzyme A synthetase/AMP-(fatty) acid ligase